MRIKIVLLYLVFFCLIKNLAGQSPAVQLVGVKIKVPDMQKAKAFYTGILNFQIDTEEAEGKMVWLKTNRYKILLEESGEAIYIKEKGYGTTSLSMQVNNLDSSIMYLKSKGVQFIKEEKRLEGIGYSMHILDPFGNPLSLDELSKPGKRVQEPWLYNCGVIVTDIDKALPVYEKLGFVAGTRNYMPDDMPLYYADKKFAFMLHRKRSDMPHTINPNMVLVFSADNEERLKILGDAIKKNKQAYQLTDDTGVKTEITIAK